MEFKHTDPLLRMEQDSDTHIYLGIVEQVDPLHNTMNVLLPQINNQKITDLAINHQLTLAGFGIKCMPVPGQSYVFVHEAKGAPNRYLHVGYYSPDPSSIMDTVTGSKSGQIIYQRYIKPGEIQIISKGRGEIYLNDQGEITIKSIDDQYLTIDSYNGGLKGSFQDYCISATKIDHRLGRVKRITTSTSSAYTILRDSYNSPYIENTEILGADYNTNGIPTHAYHPVYTKIDQNPSIGYSSFSNKVHNLFGIPEKMLSSETEAVQWIASFATGLKFGVDAAGAFWIVNTASESYIKFQPSQYAQGSAIIDNSYFEIKFSMGANFKLSQFGEFIYSNTYTKDSDNSQVTISANKTGELLLQASTDGGSTVNSIKCDASGITITDNKGDSVEPTLLGDKTTTVFTKILTAILAHTHPHAMGPTGTAINAADFTNIQNNDLPKILSKGTKNN